MAQWIRHRPAEPGIAGSSPAGVIFQVLLLFALQSPPLLANFFCVAVSAAAAAAAAAVVILENLKDELRFISNHYIICCVIKIRSKRISYQPCQEEVPKLLSQKMAM